MGILDDLRGRVQYVYDGLQTGAIVREVVSRHENDIMTLQKEQLFEGKAASGEDIRPYYSEDLKPGGYFYSVDSARRYAAWKRDGINYPYSANRNPDAPNLYINGRFHNELGVQFDPATVGIIGTTGYAREIMAKYGMETFGLTSSNWMLIFVDRGAYQELMTEIKRELYGTS